VADALVRVDPGLFIWTILTFLVLVWLLRRFAWGPLLEALDRREKLITSAVEDAQRTKAELARVREDSERLLAEARREAGSLISQARADAERLRGELREKASAEAAVISRNAEREIEQQTRRAIQQLRQEAIDLSLLMASRILQRNVSRQDNDALIQDFVGEIDRKPPQH
jgi:F-type H+-transporting ATPase subunit b